MKTTTRQALAAIRSKLGLKRLDSRRLYLVSDGAYTWLGNRADLTASDARALRAIHAVGSNPASATPEERKTCDAADYDAICSRCLCIAATHGAAGIVPWDDLPADWADGYALGPIATL